MLRLCACVCACVTLGCTTSPSSVRHRALAVFENLMRPNVDDVLVGGGARTGRSCMQHAGPRQLDSMRSRALMLH